MRCLEETEGFLYLKVFLFDMIIGLQWIKRLIIGIIGLLILIVVLGLIFSSLLLLIPIIILLICIGLIMRFFRKNRQVNIKKNKDYIDVDYQVKKE